MASGASRTLVIVPLAVAWLLASACGESRSADKTGEGAAPAAESRPPAAAEQGPLARPAPGASPAEVEADPVDGEREDEDLSASISVAECDEYLAKFEACLKKTGAPEKQAAMEAAFRAQRDAWRQSARAASDNPQVASQLAQNCRAALAAARAPMQRLGCDW